MIQRKTDNSRMGKLLQTLGTVSSRMDMANQLGKSYGGDRDLSQALGYKKELTYDDYWLKFKRGDISKTIVSKPVDAVWGNPPIVTEDDSKVVDANEDSLRNQWAAIVKEFSIYSQLIRLDKLLGLGHFAVLLLGFDDSEDFSTPLNTEDSNLLYIQPYGEGSAQIVSFEDNKNDPRYGLPKLYNLQIVHHNAITTGMPMQQLSPIRVHHTRVLHVVEDPLESPVYGTPRLEALFNRLEDLQKLMGGSAEMFWRGARPGYAAKAQTDTTFGPDGKKDMQDQFDEYENNLRRWLTLEGVDVQDLAPQVSSPKEHVDIQMMVISIVTGIPKRILTGSERGELASTQDEKIWNGLIKTRMTTFAEPQILRPLIDKLIVCNVLTTEKDDYIVRWPKMSAMGEKEKADISKTRSQAIAEYLKAPGADMLVPPEIWLRDEFGYTESQIKEIMEIVGDLGSIDDLEDDAFEGITPEESTQGTIVRRSA
jgi:hypothetical protein